MAPSCGCGCCPSAVHPAVVASPQPPKPSGLVLYLDVLTTGLAVTGGGALTTSPESATASSQPGSPAASTSTPPQQSLVAPSAASSFHHHPRGRLVSRACDRCRRRKAKVSSTSCSPNARVFQLACDLVLVLVPALCCPPLSLPSSPPPPPLCIHGFIVHTLLCRWIHNFKSTFTPTSTSSSASAYSHILACRPSL